MPTPDELSDALGAAVALPVTAETIYDLRQRIVRLEAALRDATDGLTFVRGIAADGLSSGSHAYALQKIEGIARRPLGLDNKGERSPEDAQPTYCTRPDPMDGKACNLDLPCPVHDGGSDA